MTSSTDPRPLPAGAQADPAAARAAMAARLEDEGALGPGPVRDALLTLPREVLMPQAYVRRSTPGEEPPWWDLPDWSAPQDRPELLGLLYGGAGVLIRHDGEPLLGRARGTRSGASITSMSTVMGLTSSLLTALGLRPGRRVLDVGTGAGVTAAVACQICGDQGVATLDRDRHLTDAATVRLAGLGFRPEAVCGSGERGLPGRQYDRVFVSYAMERVPVALVEQLAPGGGLLAHVTGASPSWPGLAVVERTADGRIQAELRAVEFAHRAGHGMDRICLGRDFRRRIATEPGTRTRRSTPAPPADTDRGLWLAADHLLGGLVRDSAARHLSIGAPGCGSSLRVEPAGGALAGTSPRTVRATSGTNPRTWPPGGERPAAPAATASSSSRTVTSGPHRRAAVCPGLFPAAARATTTEHPHDPPSGPPVPSHHPAGREDRFAAAAARPLLTNDCPSAMCSTSRPREWSSGGRTGRSASPTQRGACRRHADGVSEAAGATASPAARGEPGPLRLLVIVSRGAWP